MHETRSDNSTLEIGSGRKNTKYRLDPLNIYVHIYEEFPRLLFFFGCFRFKCTTDLSVVLSYEDDVLIRLFSNITFIIRFNSLECDIILFDG